MTQEEAIRTLCAIDVPVGNCTPIDEEAHEAISMAIEALSQPSLPSNLDEAAKKYANRGISSNAEPYEEIIAYQADKDAFKAGAKWYGNQMKMPNSSELISAWREVKSILQEKDFRGDEWRLAYNAFMFGFSKGLNTLTKKK